MSFTIINLVAIKDCEAEIFDKSPIAFQMNKDVRFEENPDVNCEI